MGWNLERRSTFRGGGDGVGTVFEIARGSGTLTTPASFTASTGYSPYGGLIFDAAGNLYGTTYNGGAYDAGTVFELASVASVPEPTSLLLLGLGMAGLVATAAWTRTCRGASPQGNRAA